MSSTAAPATTHRHATNRFVVILNVDPGVTHCVEGTVIVRYGEDHRGFETSRYEPSVTKVTELHELANGDEYEIECDPSDVDEIIAGDALCEAAAAAGLE